MHCGMAQVLVAKKGNVPEAEIPTRPSAYLASGRGTTVINDHDRSGGFAAENISDSLAGGLYLRSR